MSSLNELVQYYRDELRDGIAEVCFWKNNKSWYADCFWLGTVSNNFNTDDKEKIQDILKIDSNAIIINGYYSCPFTNGDEDEKASTVDFMAGHIKYRYENQMCLLKDFISELEV